MSAKVVSHKAVDPSRQPGLRIAQVFLSHADFRYKADPLTLAPPDPSTEVQMTVDIQVLTLEQSGTPAAGVRVRVRSDPASNHPYVFDVSMVAVIQAEPGNENFSPNDYAMSAGAALLFPFVRELIANLTQRARFGAVWIPPFNVQLAMSAQPVQD